MDYVRLKPDNPRLDRRKSKQSKIKYESPVGMTNRVYLPKGIGVSLFNPDKLLVVTEGEKKAIKATLEGFPTIGLVGVWGWQKTRPKDQNGRAFGKREIVDELVMIEWKDRKVAIVFDSDVAKKQEVKLAEGELRNVLRELGANVRAIKLPELPD